MIVIKLSPSASLDFKIKKLLNSITTKMTSNAQNLTEEEKMLVEKVTTIPIISLLKVKVLKDGADVTIKENDQLSEVISIELIYLYLSDVLMIIDEGINSMTLGDKDTYDTFLKNLKHSQQIVSDLRAEHFKKVSLLSEVQHKIYSMEKIVSNK